jgi:hypothetical protein
MTAPGARVRLAGPLRSRVRLTGIRTPGARGPGVRWPGVRGPGVLRPGVLRPGVLRPGVRRPGAVSLGGRPLVHRAEERLQAGGLSPAMPVRFFRVQRVKIFSIRRRRRHQL